MTARSQKNQQPPTGPDLIDQQFDMDSPSVSLPLDASRDPEDDGVILASWTGRSSDGGDYFPSPPQLPTAEGRRKDHPRPSSRQARWNPLIRGAETRSVRIRGKDIYTGDVPLSRVDGGKLVSGEGMTEILAWIVLEFHVEEMVGAFAQTQQTTIEMFGVARPWTPDGEIKRLLGRNLLFEVKMLEAIQPTEDTPAREAAEMKERVRAMKAEAARQGKDFLLLTEYEIRMEPRFHNAKMMFRALGANVPDDVLEGVRRILHDLGEVLTVRDLADQVPAWRSSMLLVACMLDREGDIRLDRGTFFSPDCEFENYRSSPSISSPSRNFLEGENMEVSP